MLDYFPNSIYEDSAKRELARLHLENDELDEAMHIFDEFAARQGDVDEYDRAIGLAGQYVVYTMEGKTNDAERVFSSFADVVDSFNPLTNRDPSLRWLTSSFVRSMQINKLEEGVFKSLDPDAGSGSSSNGASNSGTSTNGAVGSGS